jgi:hypothetical protein
MIFGPNEAGKSSALRGVHDLLYGFPERTPDAHVHPNAELRIAATLEGESGQLISVQRLKRRKDALRDAVDAPIDEGVLRSLLSGVDAPLFVCLVSITSACSSRATRCSKIKAMSAKACSMPALADAAFAACCSSSRQTQTRSGSRAPAKRV